MDWTRKVNPVNPVKMELSVDKDFGLWILVGGDATKGVSNVNNVNNVNMETSK
jgi:hypothetical protein